MLFRYTDFRVSELISKQFMQQWSQTYYAQLYIYSWMHNATVWCLFVFPVFPSNMSAGPTLPVGIVALTACRISQQAACCSVIVVS